MRKLDDKQQLYIPSWILVIIKFKGELRVRELNKQLKSTIDTNIINKLIKKGLINKRKVGVHIYYSLTEDGRELQYYILKIMEKINYEDY